METTKATHEPYNTELFAPVIKEATGKYIAILSDTSVDRDEERIGKAAIQSMELTGYVAGLIDHENKVLNQVCEWTNKKVCEIDGHTALVAEPKFFESNPNARIIRGMLDEGAQIGISIGAIVKSYEDTKINGEVMRTFTSLELLEASFVAIPSNRHGRAMAVAKSFKSKEEKSTKMSDIKYTQKDIDSAVSEANKGFESQISDLGKKLESKNTEVADLNKKLEESVETVKSLTKAKEDAESKLSETEKSLEAAKKAAIDKQKFADQGGDEEEGELSTADIDKAFAEGKLPIMRSQN